MLGSTGRSMTSLPWYDDEAGFAAELARGRRAELRVAMRLLPLGLWVKVGGFAINPDGGVGGAWTDSTFRDQFPDQADIEVEGRHLIEVKGRGFAFTSPDDYPYETAYVGAARRWAARTDPPCVVVVLSEPTGAIIAVPVKTRPAWLTEQRPDSRRGFTEESMAAPRDCLVTERRLLEHLQQPCRSRA